MCPLGTGYNYFLACDTAERIIFAVVAGSGSGKLCWHSRGNDNDQKNAGYVRESAGGSEQVLRLRAQAGAFRAPARVTFFFCKKGFIEKLVVFYLENSGHKITLYTKRWFVLANHFFLCYNIFRYFSIFGGFLLTLHQYLL